MNHILRWIEPAQPEPSLEQLGQGRRAVRTTVIAAIIGSAITGFASWHIGLRHWPAHSWRTVAFGSLIFLAAIGMLAALAALQHWVGSSAARNRERKRLALEANEPRQIAIDRDGFKDANATYAWSAVNQPSIVRGRDGSVVLTVSLGRPWWRRERVSIRIDPALVDVEQLAERLAEGTRQRVQRIDAREMDLPPRQLAILIGLCLLHIAGFAMFIFAGARREDVFFWWSVSTFIGPGVLYAVLARPRSQVAIVARLAAAVFTTSIGCSAAMLVTAFIRLKA